MRPEPLPGSGAAAAALLLLTGLAVAAQWGCGPRLPPPAPLPAEPSALAARRSLLGPFRASVVGKLKLRGRKARFSAGIGASPPGFRIDVFHPASGGTLLSLGVAGGQVQALWPDQGECLQAAAEPRLMGLLLGMEVAAEELLPLLSGAVYRDDSLEISSLRFGPLATAAGEGPPPAGRERIFIEGVDRMSGARYEAELAAERDGHALRGTRTGSDGSRLTVSYPRWNPAAAARPAHPARIDIQVPGRRLSLSLSIGEWAAGGPPEGALQPGLPPGCRRLSAQELAARGTPWSAPAQGDP